MVDPPGPQVENYSVIFRKFGVFADTPAESSVFFIFLLRFCAGVAEREREYSTLLIV